MPLLCYCRQMFFESINKQINKQSILEGPGDSDFEQNANLTEKKALFSWIDHF